MKTRSILLASLFLALSTACGTSKSEPARLVEVGRWVDDSMPAVFIFYHMKGDVPEEELKELLKPVARSHAAKYPFVIQVAVHDVAWAETLSSTETRQRYKNNELFVGGDLLFDESMVAQGGLVYTYYKDGDYDEYFYYERSDSR